MKYKYICVKQNLRHEYIGNYTSYGIALNDKKTSCKRCLLRKKLAYAVVSIFNEFQIEPSQMKYIAEQMVYSG